MADSRVQRLAQLLTQYAAPVAEGHNDLRFSIAGRVVEYSARTNEDFLRAMRDLDDGARNQSALHWDMVTDLRNGGEVRVDGKFFAKDGAFVI